MKMSVMTHRPRLPPMTVLPLAPCQQTAVIIYGEPFRFKSSSNFDINYYEPTTVKKIYLFFWTSTRTTSSESTSIWLVRTTSIGCIWYLSTIQGYRYKLLAAPQLRHRLSFWHGSSPPSCIGNREKEEEDWGGHERRANITNTTIRERSKQDNLVCIYHYFTHWQWLWNLMQKFLLGSSTSIERFSLFQQHGLLCYDVHILAANNPPTTRVRYRTNAGFTHFWGWGYCVVGQLVVGCAGGWRVMGGDESFECYIISNNRQEEALKRFGINNPTVQLQYSFSLDWWHKVWRSSEC